MSLVDSLASSFTAIKNSQTNDAVNYAVAGKQLDAQKQQGDAAVKLIETAAQVGKSINTGSNFDSFA